MPKNKFLCFLPSTARSSQRFWQSHRLWITTLNSRMEWRHWPKPLQRIHFGRAWSTTLGRKKSFLWRTRPKLTFLTGAPTSRAHLRVPASLSTIPISDGWPGIAQMLALLFALQVISLFVHYWQSFFLCHSMIQAYNFICLAMDSLGILKKTRCKVQACLKIQTRYKAQGHSTTLVFKIF